MRVVSPSTTQTVPGVVRERSRRAVRAANVEALGLAACSIVVLLGIVLASSARLSGPLAGDGSAVPLLDLRRLSAPKDLDPVLGMFAEPAERAAVAQAVFQRAASASPALEHVGGLAPVSIPAAEVRRNAHFAVLRARLDRRPGITAVPVFTSADIAAIKPSVVVRSPAEYRGRIRTAAALLLGAFWIAHLVRRRRRTEDDPVLLPILLLLCGIGLTSMIALRDPLRDTVAASTFAAGVGMGVLVLLGASELDLERTPLRRSVLAPLSAAIALASLLLLFGSGPGSSGVKVNLSGGQPVEVIRLLVVLALAAYFARRFEFLRELSEPATPGRPWLRYVRAPRWTDLRPVAVSMSLVLAFFFLQKDLGPALVLSCVFLAMYGVARGRATFVLAGFAMLVAGFALACWIGFPSTVRQRVLIWFDPWTNGVAGGNQIAHGLWALASGAVWGFGPGLGSPQSIPEGHTDFILAAAGEELGFVGLAAILVLYALLCWRCLRIAARAPGDYTAFLATGLALALVVQAFVIGSGVLGLVPLSGVVTPFLSYGKSSMLANFLAVGLVMSVARRQGPIRPHLRRPIRVLAGTLGVAACVLATRAMWIQVVRADAFATGASLTEQADGGYRFEYNPRLLAAARLIPRGTIYDRNGLPLATSRRDEIAALPETYQKAGAVHAAQCAKDGRCYPLGGIAFPVLGDITHLTNWGAPNTSYVERESDAKLQGYDDRPHVVEVVNPRTGLRVRAVKRDYNELLPLMRYQYRTGHPAVRALLDRRRDVFTSIDARLQIRTAAALRSRIEAGRDERGAAVVLDVASGEVLASVSYPWLTADDMSRGLAADSSSAEERLLDRPRYGLYPPGSTFKLLVAGAALRSAPAEENHTYACVRLPDGRVGNYVRGASRPVRDDPLDTVPHGRTELRHALVVSCNAYFAQLAAGIGPQPLLDAASLFQIEMARPQTAAALRGTLPQAGYGQGHVLVSPMKMARVAAAIADRGVVTPVSWTHAIEGAPEPAGRFLSPPAAARLSRYMREVVTSGTGRTLASNRIPIAGKTGTAEVADRPAHSWFAGFAPYGGEHKIAFAVIVENAGYGARAAAPVAGEIVTAARDIGLIK